jgi:hypothetical protein
MVSIEDVNAADIGLTSCNGCIRRGGEHVENDLLVRLGDDAEHAERDHHVADPIGAKKEHFAQRRLRPRRIAARKGSRQERNPPAPPGTFDIL